MIAYSSQIYLYLSFIAYEIRHTKYIDKIGIEEYNTKHNKVYRISRHWKESFIR